MGALLKSRLSPLKRKARGFVVTAFGALSNVRHGEITPEVILCDASTCPSIVSSADARLIGVH